MIHNYYYWFEIVCFGKENCMIINSNCYLRFRYIALELCAASLQDYVEGRVGNLPIDGVTILRHATAGVAHLHSLDIVHRDIKV